MAGRTISLTELLAPQSIVVAAPALGRDDAIRQVGSALMAVGAVEAPYIEAMIDRENAVSTYLGEGVAIPHATLAAKDAVLRDALCLVRFAQGVQWDGHQVRLAFGIAARNNGHIAILSQLATVLMAPGTVEALCRASSTGEIYELLEPEISAATQPKE